MERISASDIDALSRSEGRVKAIETRYGQSRFRSRLEARWAVFFDMFGIPFVYEHEGFELPSGKYLPDFWLPEQPAWAEVKPTRFTLEERRRCEELCVLTGDDVLLLDGLPEDRPFTVLFVFGGNLHSAELPLYVLTARTHSRRYIEDLTGNKRDWNISYDGAISAAVSARFERGEQG